MARINVDDDIECQIEYRKLLKLVGGDDDKALGMLVRFWRLAQIYWGRGELVPLEEMNLWEFKPIIESRWGIVKDDGVYAKNSEEYFGWYRQRVEAGKKRAESARDNHGQFKKSDPRIDQQRLTSLPPEPAEAQRNLIPHQPPVPAPAPTPVLALVPSQKYGEASKIQSNEKELKLGPPVIDDFIAQYEDSFRSAYGAQTNPVVTSKDRTRIHLFLKDTPPNRAQQMIRTYCLMADPWFRKKGHDLSTFFENQNSIAIAVDTQKLNQQNLEPMKDLWNEVLARLKKEPTP